MGRAWKNAAGIAAVLTGVSFIFYFSFRAYLDMSERERRKMPCRVGYAVSKAWIDKELSRGGPVKNQAILGGRGELGKDAEYEIVSPSEWTEMKRRGYDHEIAVGDVMCYFELEKSQAKTKKEVQVPAGTILFDVIKDIYFDPDMAVEDFKGEYRVLKGGEAVDVRQKVVELGDEVCCITIRGIGGDVGGRGYGGTRLCGLDNVGNTCFMNSVLQCLYNIDDFTNFFIQDRHLKRSCGPDSDRLNARREKLTLDYAELIKRMYYSDGASIAPWSFKNTLSLLNPMFKGSSQHDAPEFLFLLLDGIHEYLNVRKKEKLNKKEKLKAAVQGEAPDRQAEREWSEYIEKNKSIITDLFMGQLRSSLQCKSCQHTSIKHDPSMYLALSIPDAAEYVSVCINFFDCHRPPIRVAYHQNVSVKDLKDAVKRERGVHGNLIAVEVSGDKVIREAKDYETLPRKGVSVYEYPGKKEDVAFLVLRFSTYYIVQHRLDHPLLIDKSMDLHEALASKLKGLMRRDRRDRELGWWREKVVEISVNEKPPITIVKAVFASGSFSEIFEKDFKMESVVQREGDVFTLQNCVDFFMKKEDLSEGNAICCERCGKKTGATKQMEMVRAPRCLVVSLKKFKYTSSGQVNVFTVIDFPIERFALAGTVYKLSGACNHHSMGHGGHYTAYVRRGERWFVCNDSNVSEAKNVRKENAYLLFYEKV